MNKPKFNAMDGFLIMVLTVAIVSGLYFIFKPDAPATNSPHTVTAQYTLELTECTDELAASLKTSADTAETLMLGEKTRFHASIKGIGITPSKRRVPTETGEAFVVFETPNRFDVTLYLESQVTETNSDISASGTILKVGYPMTAKSRSASCLGTITELRLIHE